MAGRNSRLTIVFVAVVVVALAAFFGIRTLWRTAQDHFTSSHCDVGQYQLDTDQASVASTMVGAVSRYRPALPERAAVLVLAAGLQESKLQNLAPHTGDRDSVGVLQQRPSQGWGGGVASRLNDVTEATTEFLAALVRIKHWQKLPLAEAVQKVQISADGSAYAQHEPEAQALADALQGHKPAAISCTFAKPTLVATGTKVVGLLRQQLPVKHAAAQGKTVRVPGSGWQTVAWFVANADRLGVDSVEYHGKRWSRESGWQPAKSAGRGAVVATMATI
ncbi:MAG TPA: hypothetical protein VFE19_11110 [Jatrophihabitantaceae bacterium]|jgi:hypothetical protein|nr:hypothetical protein [Jatrophihabitantaceae bacterium]